MVSDLKICMTKLTILTNFRLIRLIRESHLVNFVKFVMSFYLHGDLDVLGDIVNNVNFANAFFIHS